MEHEHAGPLRKAAEALKDYVFLLADGLRVTVQAENEFEAGRIAREMYCC